MYYPNPCLQRIVAHSLEHRTIESFRRLLLCHLRHQDRRADLDCQRSKTQRCYKWNEQHKPIVNWPATSYIPRDQSYVLVRGLKGSQKDFQWNLLILLLQLIVHCVIVGIMHYLICKTFCECTGWKGELELYWYAKVGEWARIFYRSYKNIIGLSSHTLADRWSAVSILKEYV